MSAGQPAIPEDPRVRFAAERTLLAWVRTGLAMMGFGFVLARFGLFLHEITELKVGPQQLKVAPQQHSGLSLWLGTTLVVFGVILNVIAAVQHYHFLRRLEGGQPYKAPPLSAGIIVAVLLAGLGVVITAYLLFLHV